MAWRDSRRNRGRLLLFISSIVIGIAALVAINSFSENLQKDIQREAKTLTGADLIVQGGQPATDSLNQLFELLGEEERAETWSLVSMVDFPKNGGTPTLAGASNGRRFSILRKAINRAKEAAMRFNEAAAPPSPCAGGPTLASFAITDCIGGKDPHAPV